jgi:hypothetical protein
VWEQGGIFSSGKWRQGPGGRAGLDEVAKDPADLLGIGDDGKDSHLRIMTAASLGTDLIDLCKQANLSSKGHPGGHGLIRGVLGELGGRASRGGGADGTTCRAILSSLDRHRAASSLKPLPEVGGLFFLGEVDSF